MTSLFDYGHSRDTADRLITKFGRAAQVQRDAKTGSASNPDYTSEAFNTFAVKIEFTRQQVNSGNVLATDERWLVAAGPLALLGVVDLTPFQRLIVAGATLPLFKVSPVNPAGTVVLFDCHVRK